MWVKPNASEYLHLGLQPLAFNFYNLNTDCGKGGRAGKSGGRRRGREGRKCKSTDFLLLLQTSQKTQPQICGFRNRNFSVIYSIRNLKYNNVTNRNMRVRRKYS